MRIILAPLLFLVSLSMARAQVRISVSARSTQEVKETKHTRLMEIVEQYGAQDLTPPPYPPKVGFGEFAQTMISRMILKKDLDQVSAAHLKEDFTPWLPGTDIAILGKVCKRVGDYDFVLMSLLKMAYLDHEAGETLLSDKAREKLLHVLLSQKGNEHHIKFTLKNCPPFIKVKDSENHILMTEISRYLTNQLLYKRDRNPLYDNEANGFNRWFLHHLAEFMRTDFDELNSRPYQGYTLIALGVLYSHAENEDVKKTAQMILDYLAAKASIQSINMRRYAPFRRQLRHRDAENFLDTDNGMNWFAFKFGNNEFLKIAKEYDQEVFFNEYMYFMASIDSYEVPDLILNLFYERNFDILQKIKSRDVEIYHASSSFLLSAGGRHRDVFGYFTDENDTWALPTTIIPYRHGIKLSQVFSLTGPLEHKKRNNLCVTRNFACGENLTVPEGIPSSCQVDSGPWTFYDFNNCGMKLNFYVALRRLGKYAFWEVQEAHVPFQTFMASILDNNQQTFSLKKNNTYTLSNGEKVTFTWKPKSRNQYPISAVNGNVLETDTNKWKYAEGDLIKSEGDGLITITHPVTHEKLILDARDELHPRRSN